MFLKKATAIFFYFAFSSIAFSQDELPDFASKMPSSSTQLIALRNISNHAESFATSKIFKAMFDDGFMADAPFDYADAMDSFNSTKQYYPNSVVITGNDSTAKFAAQIFKLLFLLNMGLETEEAGIGVADEDMDEFIEDLTETFDGLKTPALSIWMDWEEKATCSQAFIGAVTALTFSLEGTDLELKSKKNTAILEFKLGDLFEADLVYEFLPVFGIFSDDDQAVETLIEKIGAVSIKLTIENIGTGIRIMIGESPKEFGLKGKNLLAKSSDQANEIMIASWNNKQLTNEFRTFKNLIAKWDKTVTGKDYSTVDSQDFKRDLTTLIGYIERQSESGKSRLWAEPDQLRMSVDMEDAIERTVLGKHELMKLVPRDVDSFALSGLDDLGTAVANLMLQFEERIATSELKFGLQGNLENEETLARFAEAYYASFAEFRNVIIEKLPEAFDLPSGYLFDVGGEFNLKVNSDGWKSQQDIRILKLAMIGKIKDPVKLEKALDEAWRTMLDSFSVIYNLTPDLDVQFQDITVGGVKARALDLGFIKKQFKIDVEIKGDFIPHYFIKDHFLVFSTSKSLSAQMLNQKQPLEIKKPNVVDAGKITGNSFSVILDMYVDVLEFALSDISSPQKEQMSGILEGMGRTAKSIDAISWDSVQNGTSRKTNFTMTFSK